MLLLVTSFIMGHCGSAANMKVWRSAHVKVVDFCYLRHLVQLCVILCRSDMWSEMRDSMLLNVVGVYGVRCAQKWLWARSKAHCRGSWPMEVDGDGCYGRWCALRLMRCRMEILLSLKVQPK